MARPRKHDGVVYRRQGTQFLWIRYWDGAGVRREEPTGTADWKEAQKKLRERLQARDDNVLEIVRKGEELAFKGWAELFWRTTRTRRSVLQRRMKRTSAPSGTWSRRSAMAS